MHDALLVHGGALGDFVMSLRIVAALRRSGAYRVALLGRPEYAPLARAGGVAEVFDLNAGGFHKLFSEKATIPDDVKQFKRFGIAVDMLGGTDSALHQNLMRAGIPRVVSIDPRPKPEWKDHISDQWLNELRDHGLETDVGPPAIALDPMSINEIRCRWNQRFKRDRPLAVIHPGSGSRDKCWPIDRFVQLIATLQSKRWSVLILIGRVECERFGATSLSQLRASAPTIEDRPLDETAATMAAGDLFIGNDSGVSHLAAALGRPTVAIFGPTDARRWRPMGERVADVTGTTGQWPDVENVLTAIQTLALESKPS